MTVSDPTADNLLRRQSDDVQRLAVLRPRTFDIQRVTIATTNTMLCAAVTFAQRDRVLKPGEFTRRKITLELAPARPRPRDLAGVFLARLYYGSERAVEWTPNGAIENDSDGDLDGERVTGAQRREVQLAVPVRALSDIASQPLLRSSVINLDPRSFSWRISVASDCAPGPRQLIRFPSGRRLPGPTPTADCQ